MGAESGWPQKVSHKWTHWTLKAIPRSQKKDERVMDIHAGERDTTRTGILALQQARLTLAIRHGGRILVVGAKERNTGQGLWDNPRVVWAEARDFERSDEVIPANVRAVIFTKFMSHSAFNNLKRQCKKRGLYHVQTLNSTGELRSLIEAALRDAALQTPVGEMSMSSPIEVRVPLTGSNPLTVPIGDRIQHQQTPVRQAEPEQKHVRMMNTPDGLKRVLDGRKNRGRVHGLLAAHARYVDFKMGSGRSGKRKELTDEVRRLEKLAVEAGLMQPGGTTIKHAYKVWRLAKEREMATQARREAREARKQAATNGAVSVEPVAAVVPPVADAQVVGSAPSFMPSDEGAVKLLDDAIAALQLARDAYLAGMAKQREVTELKTKLRELLG